MAEILLMNSGGLDSALLAAYATRNLGHTLHSVYIDSGQVNRIPAMAAAQTTATKFCLDHHVITVDFGQTPNYWEKFYVDPPEPATMYDAAPNATWKQTPQAKAGERTFQEFHTTPNWAMLELSVGVAYAKMLNVEIVITGHRLAIDDKYLMAFNQMADMRRHKATRATVQSPFADDVSYKEAAIKLVGAPLTTAKKNALRAEFAYTHSCLWPTPCGVCEKCTGRAALGLT